MRPLLQAAIRMPFFLWLAGLFLLSTGCVPNQLVGSEPGLGLTTQQLSTIDAERTIMVVIKDPRGERYRRGLGTPGYGDTAAYADDPALDRAGEALARKYSLTLVAHWPLRNLPVLCLVVEEPSRETVAKLRADKNVQWVQAFNEFSTQATSAVSASFTPGDYQSIFAEPPGHGAGVTVAIIDTSFDTSHPSLARSSIRQQNFAGSQERIGNESHGTAVVGLIAAQPHSGTQLLGIAREATVEVLRACWQHEGETRGRCNTLTLALALDRAIDLTPEVLNLSITGPADRVLEKLVDQLLRKGTLVVAAFDEALMENERFPRSRDGVAYAFGTSGTDRSLPNAKIDTVLLTAPRHALSLAPAASYDLVSGHSVAAPQVSGLAARLIASKPDASREEILTELSSRLAPRQHR
ncbi:MAG: S8 family serine peptidase [Pseudomonadota bacterium]